MLLETILTSTVVAAVISAITSVLVESKKRERELELLEQRLRADFQLDRERVRTEFMAEQVARKLLQSPKYKKRSFRVIHRRLKGFEEDELRKILVRAGAVSFDRTHADTDEGLEFWGLLDRNQEAID